MASSSRAKFTAAGFQPHLVRIPASPSDPLLDHLEIYALRRKAKAESAPDGAKEPLLLIHGHPQNLLIWHRVAPALVAFYTEGSGLPQDRDIVIADLRGHGQSGVPRVRNFVRLGHNPQTDASIGVHAQPSSSAAGGGSAPTEEGSSATGELPDEEALRGRYSKREMARDMVCLMKHLGYEHFGVVGHDRGGRVAHRMALDYPKVVTKVMTLDIVPTFDLYDRANSFFAEKYWHWFFLIQPYPMPEEMILGAPQTYLNKATGRSLGNPSHGHSDEPLFPQDVMVSYLAQLSSPPRVHATCEDYRCSAPGGIDFELDETDRKAGHKVMQPLRALWGARNLNQAMFGEEGCLDLWRNVCAGEVSGRSYVCGHYMPEEIPGDIVDEIVSFF